MENKLQQLTQKLYDEGLEKGRAEAERLVSEAKSEAAKIIADAKAEAEAIVKAAEAKAEDTAKNSMTEIALAGKQAVARIKEEISSLIAAESTFSAVKAANLDPEFVKAMLLSVAFEGRTASAAARSRAGEVRRCVRRCGQGAARSGHRSGLFEGGTHRLQGGRQGRQLLHLLLGRRFRGTVEGVSARQDLRTAVQSLTPPCSIPTIIVW